MPQIHRQMYREAMQHMIAALGGALAQQAGNLKAVRQIHAKLTAAIAACDDLDAQSETEESADASN